MSPCMSNMLILDFILKVFSKRVKYSLFIYSFIHYKLKFDSLDNWQSMKWVWTPVIWNVINLGGWCYGIAGVSYGCQFESWFFHFWTSSRTNARGEAAEDGSSAWASAPRRETGKKFPAFGFILAQPWPPWPFGE